MSEADNMWVSIKDVRVASLTGHVTFMKAGEPKRLPPDMASDAHAAGCVQAEQAKEVAKKMADAAEAAEANKEAVGELAHIAETMAEDRKAALVKTLEEVRERNDPDEFTKLGLPRTLTVESHAGMDFKAEEVAAVWAEINTE